MSNPHADRVRDIAKLSTRRGRTKKKQFMVEGPQAVREALKAHLQSPLLDAVYVTESAYERHPDIAELLEQAHGTPTPEEGRRVFMRVVTDEVLAAMADSVTPQGIIAISFMVDTSFSVLWGENALNPKLIAVLSRIQDPGNAGTILRVADAAGADLVITTKGSVDLYNPKTVRSTAGSLFHVPIIQGVELEEFAEDVKSQGTVVLAADGYGTVNLQDLIDHAAVLRAGFSGETPAEVKGAFDLSRPTMWLFGNEAQGLSAEEKSAATMRIAVPVYGAAESLNVGTAAAICLYASAMAQHQTQ
ncbi:TrmH family RNA methyltransferase [Rothia dentocariosa]|uniref:TrmH family RNA methyltransferase n=1 Tax=Rothia dentocariosa TaxID=2047 RepID=UPI00249392F5|nr:RNA methyltransferase [Rothia dentocariosa]